MSTLSFTAVPRVPEAIVSAIVSTYNSERFMRGCLEDLCSQTLFAAGRLEIIVVDSASPQNEQEIVWEFIGRYGARIRYIRTDTRESIYQAWNRGIRAASGLYLTNANTDDRHRCDALEQMATALDMNPDVALVYADVFVTNFPDQTFDHHIRCGYQLRPDYAPEIMLSGCHMGPQPMWRRCIHNEIGLFSDEYLSAGDYEFWCRMARGYPLRHIPQFLGLYYENPEGFANRDTGLSRQETARIKAEYAADFPPPNRDYLMSLQFWRQEDYRGWANLCMETRNSMPGLQDTVEALVRLTEYPHTISVADRASSDATRDFLQALKRGGVITNLVLLGEDATSAEALEAARSCEPDASYQFDIRPDSRGYSPGWLTGLVARADRAAAAASAPLDADGQNKAPSGSRLSLLFVMYGWKETGGGTVFPRAAALELSRRGYRVSVLYASLDNDPSQPGCAVIRQQEEGVALFGMINRPATFTDPDNPRREINDPNVRAAFCRVLDEVRPDVVHFHNFHGLTFSLAEETFSRGLPSVLTPHNYHLIDPDLYLLKHGAICWDDVDPLKESDAVIRNPHLAEWYHERIRTTRKLLNEWVTLTLAVSHRQRDQLIRYGADPARIAVIHQVSPSADDLWKDPSLEEKRLRPVKQPLQIGYIGGIVPIKGVQMLVAAAQAFDPDEIRVHLHGFGIADFMQTLKVQDKKGLVTFHGPFGPDDLRRIADGLDLAVIPSIVEESAPTLVLAELFAMRIPVVAASIGGIPEFIADGIDGRLYPPNDLNALIEILRELIDNPDRLATMRRSLTAPTHTFARYMEHLEKVYAELCAGAVHDATRLSLSALRRGTTSRNLPAICWQGGLFANHSLAHVNRELCLQLLDRGYRISFTPSEPDDFPCSIDPRFDRLEAVRTQQLEGVDITIHHQWPPDFTPPDTGHWVMIQPWEFGSLPACWIEPMRRLVDEVWVPSTYVRECYIKSGVPEDRVQVVPNGVNINIFRPDSPPLQLETTKGFRFLFVGGTIHRKGIDLLLGAYRHAFTAADDVCLVIKDMGGSSFYQGQTAEEMIRRFRLTPNAPQIEYIDRDLTPTEMAGLYRSCHCLVHPYRGEGFGLPIAEAMACGIPPIVTGYGAALDFCTPDNAWLIPARVEMLAVKKIGAYETVGSPWLAEPDFDALVSLLHHAATHPDEVASRGDAACRFIRDSFTWEAAADRAEERITEIAGRAVRRLSSRNDPDHGIAAPSITGADPPQLRERLTAVCANARICAQRGDTDTAVATILKQGISAAPTSPLPYLELTEILLAAKRYEDALQVVPEMPDALDAALKHEIRAICHAALGDNQAAQQAALQSGNRPRALVVLGTLAARRGDQAEAEQFFRRGVAADPECGSGWLSLGMLLWGKGKQEDAFQAVKRAVTVDPLNDEAVQILRDMAIHYTATGRHLEDTLRTISDAALLYPDSRSLALAHAGLLARCGHHAAALNACETFLLRFGIDAELLATALTLRNLIGSYTRLAEERRESISLCMIVKDEERNLPRCLASIRAAVHEMIVVDTGSTDRTRDIATLFGARLFDFPWNGSFAEARNHGIDQANGCWIFLLDADELLSVRDHASLVQTVASAGMQAFSVLTRNYTRQVNAQGWTPNDGSYPDAEAADGWKPSWKVRLFPNDPRFRFTGEVHEMVETSLRDAGIMIRQAPFVVHHYGELEEDPGRLAAKRQRYFEIGRRKLEANPDDLTALAELAVQAGELGNFAEAITLWDRLLSSRPDNVEALFNKGYNLMMLKRYEESLAASQRALELDPDLKEAAFNLATCKLYTGVPEEGIVVAEEYVSRYPDYPLLNAILVALYLAAENHEHALLGAKKLLTQNYSISQYIRERADVLATQGYVTLADRLRTGIVILDNHAHPMGSDEKQNSRQQR